MSRKTYLVGVVVWVLLLVILQTTILPRIGQDSLFPDPLLVFVIVFGLSKGPGQGALMGMITGLMLDFLGLRVIGLNTVLRGGLGFLAGFTALGFYRENVLVPIMATAVATLVSEGVLFFFAGLMGITSSWSELFLSLLPSLLLYNLLLTPLIFFLFRCFEQPFRKSVNPEG